jgi:hypothetical protein
MRPVRAVVSLLAAGLTVAATVVVQPAWAAPVPAGDAAVKAGVPTPGGRRHVVAEDTGWAPVSTYFEIGGGVCGAGLIDGGQKTENSGRQQRTITFRNGDVVTLLRGSVLISAGVRPDELPGAPPPEPRTDVWVSGTVTQVRFASGAFFIDRTAGSIIAVHTDPGYPSPEQAAYTKAGLSSFYQLRKGRLVEYISPEEKAVLHLQKRSKLINMCDVVPLPSRIPVQRDHPVQIRDTSGIGEPAELGLAPG